MQISKLTPSALGACAVIAMLAGCNSAGSQVAPLGPAQQKAAPSTLNAAQRESIVYTPDSLACSVRYGNTCSFKFDVNNNSKARYTIEESYYQQCGRGHCWFLMYVDVKRNKGIKRTSSPVVTPPHTAEASALTGGSPIGAMQSWKHPPVGMAGPLWYNAGLRYLGLGFHLHGKKTYYGWAQLSVTGPIKLDGSGVITTTLTGYAFETEPGRAILAGQM